MDITNPQTWNRYAYATNNPCGMIDPLGLATCSYNIALLPGKNSPLRNPNVTNGIEAEISRIFGLADLGVNFGTDSPDFTLVVANLVPPSTNIAETAIGSTPVFDGVVADRGYVYASRLEEFDVAAAQNTGFLAIGLGRAGSHEIGHYLLQLTDHTSSGLMQSGFNGATWHLPDNTGQFAFTPGQVSALQKDCANRRKQSGGGGPAGGGGSGALFGYGGSNGLGGLMDLMNWINSDPIESVTTTIFFPAEKE